MSGIMLILKTAITAALPITIFIVMSLYYHNVLSSFKKSNAFNLDYIGESVLSEVMPYMATSIGIRYIPETQIETPQTIEEDRMVTAENYNPLPWNDASIQISDTSKYILLFSQRL